MFTGMDANQPNPPQYGDVKWIFFDCMETLITIDPVPTQYDYAEWAFTGSGVEHLWDGLGSFHTQHLVARRLLEERLEPGAEYDISTRLHIICSELNGLDSAAAADAVGHLLRTFRSRYYSHCSAAPGSRGALTRLREKYRMAVVSNFIVADGIEEMLTAFGLAGMFEFIITSVAHGHRKPHPSIYGTALAKAEVPAGQVLFIGDDTHNDYTVPQQRGMHVLHYDPAGKGGQSARFGAFNELPGLLDAP